MAVLECLLASLLVGVLWSRTGGTGGGSKSCSTLSLASLWAVSTSSMASVLSATKANLSRRYSSWSSGK